MPEAMTPESAPAEVPAALPGPGGPPRAVLMLVHPRLLFLYCVKDAALEGKLARAGGPAELLVEMEAEGRSFRETARHAFDFRAPNWYLPNTAVDCMLRVRLGIRERTGFREILASNVVRVPREGAGAGPETWMKFEEGRPHATPREAPRPRRAVPAGPRTGAAPRTSSPGAGPGWQAGTRLRAAGTEQPVAAGVAGDLCVVLHSHLPFVRHPERDYFLEENWLFEAITETYLPLLDMFDHLAEDAVPARVTLSLSPTLMSMLRDPLLVAKYERHLDKTCVLAGREVQRTRRDADCGPVAGFYLDRLERLKFLFSTKYGRDLVGRFAGLESEGRIEIVACAATHGLLPLLAATPESVRAQIAVGVREHRRQIGRAPHGMWIPECAHFEGLDGILAEQGIEYFFVDAHAIRNASSPPRLDLHAPLVCPSGVAAFGRDEECSTQVWSAEQGYPGDPSYRDFYRDIGFDLDQEYVGPFLDPAGMRGMTGLKYYRITGLHDRKEPYRRDWALRTLERHAADFAHSRRAQCLRLAGTTGQRPLLMAMYDAELFGHWWFEGPEWLEAVLRKLPAQGLRAVSPRQYLADQPRQQVAEPSASSWGDGGYYEVWLGGPNDWIYPPLHDAARRMIDLASRDGAPDEVERRILAQAGRELLLAQASDWPFILRNRTSEEYALRRIHDHLGRFDRLARQLEEGRPEPAYLAAVEARDNLFPDLDYRLWRRA